MTNYHFIRLKYCITVFLTISIMSLEAQPRIKNNATVERVATGYKFLEGPLWVDGLGLLFSDIQGNTVYLRSATTQQITPYFTPSGGGNGLVLDRQGNLIIAQQNKRTVAKLVNGKEVTIASTFEGKKLNSPNDVVVKSDGSIFFTDPPYGINASQEELKFYGIYRLSPKGVLQVLDKSLNKPNGIVFSPDESKLYVSNTEERKIYCWDVLKDSTLANRREFFAMKPQGNADGMTIDEHGYIYCTGPMGVWVIAPNGTVVDTIMVPEKATNCAFGDADGQSLYVTSGISLYKVRNATVTSVDDNAFSDVGNPLGGIHPNPVAGKAFIPVPLDVASYVKLEVIDANGKVVEILHEGNMSRGIHSFSWQCTDMVNGIYFVHLTVSGKVFTKALVVHN